MKLTRSYISGHERLFGYSGVRLRLFGVFWCYYFACILLQNYHFAFYMQEIPIFRQGDLKVYPDEKSGFPFLKNKLLSFYKILQANSPFCPATFYRAFIASTELFA